MLKTCYTKKENSKIRQRNVKNEIASKLLSSSDLIQNTHNYLVELAYLYQSCIFRFGTRFGLAIGMEYFGTGQYRRSVSGLPQKYIYIYIYIDLPLCTFIYQNL